jgi:hypothetical protein
MTYAEMENQLFWCGLDGNVGARKIWGRLVASHRGMQFDNDDWHAHQAEFAAAWKDAEKLLAANPLEE